ncbi:hypothetical protein H8959_001028 [Pygathrix nigripes]
MVTACVKGHRFHPRKPLCVSVLESTFAEEHRGLQPAASVPVLLLDLGWLGLLSGQDCLHSANVCTWCLQLCWRKARTDGKDEILLPEEITFSSS